MLLLLWIYVMFGQVESLADKAPAAPALSVDITQIPQQWGPNFWLVAVVFLLAMGLVSSVVLTVVGALVWGARMLRRDVAVPLVQAAKKAFEDSTANQKLLADAQVGTHQEMKLQTVLLGDIRENTNLSPVIQKSVEELRKEQIEMRQQCKASHQSFGGGAVPATG